MATASDVRLAQDGGHAKLHPYLIALVRWCMSCLWSTASVFVHRLVTAQLPPITASKQASKPRAAGTDHLHPEPKVECVVLHTPAAPTLDVIFMHGLYGSLGNTWRQGDWRSKYKLDPTKVPLRNHPPQPCACGEQQEQPYTNTSFAYETNLNETEINETVSFQQINGCFKKILPHENSLITEKFYNNTFLNVNNYETQANFVTELFKNDCNKNCDVNIIKCNVNGDKCNGINKCKCKSKNGKLNECSCGISEEKVKKCEAGCGCVCDDCYSTCWPRDWIKEDFPGARVISVNYTSDPYLWRPLWIKGCKRLRLHERAEQMISQLLELGVGQRPIVWVGHSKGGLFIKQIYCQAYEAYIKLNDKNINDNKINNNTEDQSNNSDYLNNYNNSYENTSNIHVENENGLTRNDTNVKMVKNNDNLEPNDVNSMNTEYYLSKNDGYTDQNTNSVQETENLLKVLRNTDMFGCGESDIRAFNEFLDLSMGGERADSEASEDRSDSYELVSSNEEEDISSLASRSSLWVQSVGFMFYSVPHRGSPLAAIKTPITARSIELLEISKDCPLVLELQARWLRAAGAARPAVRSLVETGRTLMALLWLRIVSVDSAGTYLPTAPLLLVTTALPGGDGPHAHGAAVAPHRQRRLRRRGRGLAGGRGGGPPRDLQAGQPPLRALHRAGRARAKGAKALPVPPAAPRLGGRGIFSRWNVTVVPCCANVENTVNLM